MAEEYQGHRNLIIVSFCCLKILDILNLSTSQNNIFFSQPKTLVTHVDSSNSYFYNKVTRFMLPVKIKVVSKIYMVCFFLRALCHSHRSQFSQLSEVAQWHSKGSEQGLGSQPPCRCSRFSIQVDESHCPLFIYKLCIWKLDMTPSYTHPKRLC